MSLFVSVLHQASYFKTVLEALSLFVIVRTFTLKTM